MAISEVIDIQIPTDEIQKAEAAVTNYRRRTTELKEELKKLRAENKEGTVEYTRKTVELKELNGELRTNERVLIANKKATEASSGSIKQLREQLKVVSAQWAELSEEERENSEAGKDWHGINHTTVMCNLTCMHTVVQHADTQEHGGSDKAM